MRDLAGSGKLPRASIIREEWVKVSEMFREACPEEGSCQVENLRRGVPSRKSSSRNGKPTRMLTAGGVAVLARGVAGARLWR